MLNRRVLLVTLFLFGLSVPAWGDWPRYRGPEGNGKIVVSTRVDPTRQAKLIWQHEVGAGFSSFAVRGSRVVTLGHRAGKDIVTCLSLQDGKSIWTFGYESALDDNMFEGGPTSTPTISNDIVFTVGREGQVYALKLDDGSKVWSLHLAKDLQVPAPGWGFGGSPVIVDDLVLLNAAESGIALDKRNGSVRWKSELKEAGYSTPVLAGPDNATVIFTSGKYVVGRTVKSGEEQWRFRWLTQFGANAADPIPLERQVFASSGYNRGSGLFQIRKGEKPATVWKHKDYQTQFSSSIQLGSCLYGFDGNTHGKGRLKCVEWETGKIQWSAAESGLGQLIAINDQLVVLHADGKIEIAKANEAEYRAQPLGQASEGKYWTVPAFSAGRLLVRSASGSLQCFQLPLVSKTND